MVLSETATFKNVLYLNARSIKAFVPLDDDPSRKVCKMSILQELVYSNDYDIICLCETWLNDSVLNNELLPGYSIHRRDRQAQIGGGVLVAVRTNMKAAVGKTSRGRTLS
jgi:exonuclease III